MYLYERREWSILCLSAIIAGLAMACAIVYAEGDGDVLFSRWFFPALLLIGIFAALCRGYIWIALSASELKVQVGIFPVRRSVKYKDILKIERTRLPWYKAKTVKGIFTATERYAVSPGPAFQVFVAQGKNFILQSRHTEEILAILKRNYPSIEII